MIDPKVGVITRTKNRPVMLKRAIESVVFQTYRNWIMVIVNDGGNPAPIEALVAHYAEQARGRIRVVHNPSSLGMEGASAVGIAAVESELLVVHDDDDSWSPEFLTVTIAELGRLQREYATVEGVTTYSNRVVERVQGQLIQIDSVEPYNSWIAPGFLSLDRMLVSNILPPISFLFTRKAFDALGGVYEEIPYLGDWDFLVRFLIAYDVFMIPQYLAFYHWRTRSNSMSLSNTVTGEVDRHHFYRQLLLNRWLRADLAAGRFGVGAYANLRTHLETIIHSGGARVAPSTPPVQSPPPAVKTNGYIAPKTRSERDAEVSSSSRADEPSAASMKHGPLAALKQLLGR